jgi:hypothetical protein
MTSDGLGEMFEGDSADMCTGKFPLVSMRGRAEGFACEDPGARTPIGASRIEDFFIFSLTVFGLAIFLDKRKHAIIVELEVPRTIEPAHY